jgi:hypothetical protein
VQRQAELEAVMAVLARKGRITLPQVSSSVNENHYH